MHATSRMANVYLETFVNPAGWRGRRTAEFLKLRLE